MRAEQRRIALALLTILVCSGCAVNQASEGDTQVSTGQIQAQQQLTEKVDNVAESMTSSLAPDPTPPEQPANPPEEKVETLVPYKGPIEHIFFHPLIAYPKLAFDNDSMSKGYDDWFVTVKEFEKIIWSLYANNYILIDIHSLIDETQQNGKTVVTQKELLLPENKKPLVLSIDDMNYYDYMLKNGNVYKLILDDQGNIATYSLTPAGEKRIAYDNEIIPILDQFVKEHSDFSFHGAKGVIALTGYQGVLGYRTNLLDSPRYATEKDEALKVIKRLKETGWTFASHGYGHLDANKVSYDRLASDTQQWKKEVESLTGRVNVYIYPYGSRVETDSKKYHRLVNSGFDILCSVGPAPYVKVKPDALMMDRRHIDGISLKTQGERMLGLFNASEVIDSVRPTDPKPNVAAGKQPPP